jgi:hypothetical protein
MTETLHTQLPQCTKAFDELRHTIHGNGDQGLKTLMYGLEGQVKELSLDVAGLKAQSEKIQRLMWWGFGFIFAANLFMKGDAASVIRALLASLQ